MTRGYAPHDHKGGFGPFFERVAGTEERPHDEGARPCATAGPERRAQRKEQCAPFRVGRSAPI
jgi:hypothetical protein